MMRLFFLQVSCCGATFSPPINRLHVASLDFAVRVCSVLEGRTSGAAGERESSVESGSLLPFRLKWLGKKGERDPVDG